MFLSLFNMRVPASELPVSVEVEITNNHKRFPKYQGFVFSNPTRDFDKIQNKVYDGKLDNTGVRHIEWKLPPNKGVPSGLTAKITAKVLEKGGRPNINWTHIPINPYPNYVGIEPPQYYYVATGTDTEIPVIYVSPKGEPVSGKTLTYNIYRNDQYWWWHYDGNRNMRFKAHENTVLIKHGTIGTRNIHSNIQFLPIQKGTYFVEVIDEEGGHSSGVIFRSYPWGSSPGGDKNAGTLMLNKDKNMYYVGDVAELTFPSAEEGAVLVTIEKGEEILSYDWHYPSGEKDMKVKIPITKNMTPNAYISVSLMQPHSQTLNDRPIRMFGILPITVEDRDTRHEIEIITADQFRPKEPFEITLQTKDHKQTQFTIAVVDEGLLNITRFKTPDPWSHFFQKTRLGILTYDLFSQVIAANKGDVFKTFSIGGDMDYRKSQTKKKNKKKRFKPVTFFKGPIYTDSNGKATVNFDMPNYIGSVKIMVIGARGNSYARAEKAVPVKTELMMLPTLPRVIGPDEKFTIPVTVFAMQDNIGKVDVKVEIEGPLGIEGSSTQTLNFPLADDQDCFFDLFTKNAAGQSKITLTAKSANFSAEYIVDLDVRPSSPRIYKMFEDDIEKGQSLTMQVPGDGIEGTNNATLTISNFPAINFGHRLKWLIHYPYGCLEQTTSSVFPQLYIKNFIKYPDAYAEEIDRNIDAGLQKLRRFQTFSGGFAYWPYRDAVSAWGNLYAGHFMVEAKKLGYHVTPDLYENWLSFTKQQARNRRDAVTYRVYRTYILALAGQAELSEMNILYESHLSEMNNTNKCLLAASYHLASLPEKAKAIMQNTELTVENYTEFSGTYGSGLRDKAMILDALVAMKMFDKADDITREISKSVSATTWYSTQTIGYSLLALGKNIINQQSESGETKLIGKITLPDGSIKEFNTDKSFSVDITSSFGKDVKVEFSPESSTNKLYTTLNWNGVPLKSTEEDFASKLDLYVKWKDEDGAYLDITELKQGTTFYGHFTVTNSSSMKSVEEIALVQVLPSGWEIENMRLLNQSKPTWMEGYKLNQEEYLDIRDDRIMWFFDLHKPYSSTKDFIVKLNTVTIGEFELPPTITEAMYNGDYKALMKGKRVKVTKP